MTAYSAPGTPEGQLAARVRRVRSASGTPYPPRNVSAATAHPRGSRRARFTTCGKNMTASSSAIRQSERSGYRDLITFDMGGTSTDVCLVRDGVPVLTSDVEIDGLPRDALRRPSVRGAGHTRRGRDRQPRRGVPACEIQRSPPPNLRVRRFTHESPRDRLVPARYRVATPSIPELSATEGAPRSDTVTIFDAGERRAARRINRRALLDAGECEGPLLIGTTRPPHTSRRAGVRGSMRITTSF